MKRLGKFTKTIYDENYDFSNCPECCTSITDEQANDEEFINKHHIKDLMDCVVWDALRRKAVRCDEQRKAD